ncbi:MAG: carbon-nitrogen hydrolase family protein [Saprospiraceae bacterium]|nr:carbon-nitrogen hydrolase family protein [Saprospiraceae bacterium]MBK9727516.1 carbon-nitrogen hydrolase family protein [Saprospiraceae bacterium]
MKIAAAQIKSYKNNTEANIQNHLRMIELAAQQNVGLILFPEMSLTGYERELAKELSFDANDSRLNIFCNKAIENNMIILVGAPIKINSQLYIGSFIFLPDGSNTIYTKQNLHEGEEKYFSPSSKFNPLIHLQTQRISVAICADIANPGHPANASQTKSTLYLVSFFYTPGGIAKGYELLSIYAKKYSMNVLMANYTGSSYGLEGAGQSGFWNSDGKLNAQLNNSEENLLIIVI